MNDTTDPDAEPAAPAPPVRRPWAELIALGLAILWVAAVAIRMTTADGTTGALSLLMTLLTVALPLVLVWATVSSIRTMASLREEAGRLQMAVDAMRHAYLVGQQTGVAPRPAVEKKLDDLAAAQRRTDLALAKFTSRRDPDLAVPSADRREAQTVTPEAPASEAQTVLPLGVPLDMARASLSTADFIRALHFPEGPDDKAGFRALRLALEDRETSHLIRAAQDVLTLLSQDGIYMDDLVPERCRPEVWRRFAAGERGRGIAALGGVRDRERLAQTALRMREDPVFRDAAHHFLRSFDRTVTEFEKVATDTDLAHMGETRTARAFMLFGRVTGSFD